MASLNKNRLHLLVSLVVAMGLVVYVSIDAAARYRAFVKDYETNRGQEYIERHTGLPYAQWYKLQVEKCALMLHPDPAVLFPQEDLAQREEACVSGVTIDQIVYERSGESMAAVKDAVPRALGCLIGLLLISWLTGFAVAKFIPSASVGLWRWLHGKVEYGC